MNRPPSRISARAAFVAILLAVAVVQLDARTDLSLEHSDGRPGLGLTVHVNLGASPAASSLLASLSETAQRLRDRMPRGNRVAGAPETSPAALKCREC